MQLDPVKSYPIFPVSSYLDVPRCFYKSRHSTSLKFELFNSFYIILFQHCKKFSSKLMNIQKSMSYKFFNSLLELEKDFVQLPSLRIIMLQSCSSGACLHAYTQERGWCTSVSSRPGYSTDSVLIQPRLYKETLSGKTKPTKQKSSEHLQRAHPFI